MRIFKQSLNIRKNRTIFICQISQDCLRVAKCYLGNLARREFSGVEFEAFDAVLDDKMLADKTARAFKRLGYNFEPVVICLNRDKSTCRYIKVPSTQPTEIERIANLQAPRYIPYQQNELITGYQVIASSRDGYSHINLSIVHKDIIERLTKILQGLKAPKITIALSSYGLVNLFNYLYPHDQSTNIIVDMDQQQAELVIVGSRKSLFSRSLRFNKEDPAWKKHFSDEIKRTRDAYLKEVSRVAPKKIVIFGQSGLARELSQELSKEFNLPAEAVVFTEKLKLPLQISDKLSVIPHSFAAIIGLGLEELPESLNMLPLDLKEASKRQIQNNYILRLAFLAAAIIMLFALGLSKNLNNKVLYLKKLKAELSQVNAEAKPLEEMDKRLKILEFRSLKKPSTMDIISGLFRAIPANIQLVSLNFDQDGQIILRGQAQDLNSVFNLIPELEKSPALAKFGIKVRYATKKNTERGEIVDFEIICQRR